jgi:F-type H+-transporting ATPase subunit alpha
MFDEALHKTQEVGIVTHINHPIVKVSGLPHAKPHEVVICETGQTGEVFSVDKETITIYLFSKDIVHIGTKIARTDTILSIGVGKELMGRAVNPLGQLLFRDESYSPPSQQRTLDQDVKKVQDRVRINQPLRTGVAVADLLVPLGKGQRELVIGDRKTGKTSFLLTAMRNQIYEGNTVIYCAIGKKKSEIKQIIEYFEENKLLNKMVIIATDSQDPSSLIYLTPFVGMTLAEYFSDQGEDALVLFDDLTTHAKFYRELSLLGGRFPGRDSYPGDIFYIHAKLLERAGTYKHPEKKEVSITCLPVIETVEADLTGYIQTSLMGITDGHIFFDSNVFSNGRRPAVNIALSVTRAGKQTQSKLKKDINSNLSAFLAKYEKLQNFSHFGAELSPDIVKNLKRGEKLYEFFNQHYDLSIPEEIQLMFLALIWLGIYDHETGNIIEERVKSFVELYKSSQATQYREYFTKLVAVDTFQDLQNAVQQQAQTILGFIQKSS